LKAFEKDDCINNPEGQPLQMYVYLYFNAMLVRQRGDLDVQINKVVMGVVSVWNTVDLSRTL